MHKGRMEAFSDGVIAIIITIMVLELKVPHGDNYHSIKPLIPVFISYILSFINVAIYWNNHHHLMHAVRNVNGKVLWANIHLLFWLSLIPFTSGWMGENNFTSLPMACYGTVLFMCGVAYFLLVKTLLQSHDRDSTLATAIGDFRKGKVSVLIYFLGIVLAYVNPWISLSLYALVAAIWFIPDKKIEKGVSVQ